MPILGKFRSSPQEEDVADGIVLGEKKTHQFPPPPWETTEFSMGPRYRLRDLFLGNSPFNDDGER